MPPLRQIKVKAEPIKEEIVELDDSEPEELQPEMQMRKVKAESIKEEIVELDDSEPEEVQPEMRKVKAEPIKEEIIELDDSEHEEVQPVMREVKAEPIKEEIVELDNSEPEEVQPEMRKVKAEPIKEETEIVELDVREPKEVPPEMYQSTGERKPSTTYTNLKESALEGASGCINLKSKNSKRCEKRKHSSGSDLDFDLGDGSSEEDDDFVHYNVSDEEQQTVLFENWRQQNFGHQEVFKTIKSIPQGISIYTIRKLLKAPSEDLSARGSYEFYIWSLFVKFCKEFKKNPYAPSPADLVNFNFLVKRFVALDEHEKEGEQFILAIVNSFANNNIMLKDLRGITADLQGITADQANSRGLELKLKCWTRDSFFNAFILFCQKPSINQDPFDCKAFHVASFLKNSLDRFYKETVFFSPHNIFKQMIANIQFHQKSNYDNSVKMKLSEAPEIVEFLGIVSCVDLGIDSFSGSLVQDDDVFDLTPACKYIKYAKATNNVANFWNEKAVTSLLKDVFTKKNDPKECVINPKAASIILGASFEMVMAHRPEMRRPLVMRAFEKLGSAEIFWSEVPEVIKTMSLVKSHKISIEEGAFKLGASVADLRNRVKPLDPLPPPMKEVKKVAIPKKNPLEKMYEEVDKNMPEYDRIRQKNIRERLSLYKTLGLDLSKLDCVRHIPKKAAEVIQPRQKSRRLMKQMAHKTMMELDTKPGVEQSLQIEPDFLSALTKERIIPPVPILLEDLSSIEQPLSESLKFLSALDQELKWSEKLLVKSGKVKQENRDDIELKAICTMSTEQIMCGAVMSNSEMDLVCTGDKSGSLGIWLVQEEEESGLGTMYANRRSYFHFKTHTAQINSVTFNKLNPSQVISSSNDGFIRSVDLATEQVVEVLYKSYNHYHDWANIEICHQDFMSANQLIILQTKITENSRKPLSTFFPRRPSSAFIFDIRSQNQLLIGQEDLFTCQVLSLNPTNLHLLAGVVKNKVVMFDLRQATLPVHEIAFNERSKPVVAEYSSKGQKMLVSTTYNFSTSPQAVVVDLEHPSVYDAQHFESAQKLMGKLVKEDRWHLVNRGNVRCVWHPSQEGAIFAVLDAATVLNGVAGLDTSFLATINKDCSATTCDMNFNSHFGLVAERNSRTLLALNSHDNGTVAFMKF